MKAKLFGFEENGPFPLFLFYSPFLPMLGLSCQNPRNNERANPFGFGNFHHFFKRRVSMHGHCHVWPWLIELSGVALSCFTHSRLIFLFLLEPEDSFNVMFKAILYAVS